METPFLGGTYVSKSRDLVYNRAVNIYPELVETKEGKAVGAMYGCDGLKQLATTFAGQPVRGLYFASTGVLYGVVGHFVFSCDQFFRVTYLGGGSSQLLTNSGSVNFADNGQQLLIIDGLNGWCLNFSTQVFTNVLPGNISGIPLTLTYQDGFALVGFAGGNKFYQSNLNDFTAWNGLAFSSADSTPTKINAMFDVNREVWIFKSDRTEVWDNIGASPFALQRVPGVQIQQGCVAQFSIARIDNTIVWLGLDEQGQGVVYRSQGYNAVRISTHSIERAISGMANITDAIGYVYQKAGHIFYMLTFPTGNMTFCYDAATKLWHERALFAPNSTVSFTGVSPLNAGFNRHISISYAFAYNTHVVGSYTGFLYSFSEDSYTDYDLGGGKVPRKWLRTWRALPPNKEVFTPMRFNSLQIDCQTGISIPDGTSPQFILRWSDDGGFTWSSEVFADGDQPGFVGTRVLFQRLGATKRGKGTDRIFELSQVDSVPVAIIGADLDAEML